VTPARVIIADDHALFRNGLRQILVAEGVDVVGEAASGEEALEQVAAHPGSVLLLDISMPGHMDGLETARRLHESGADVKVVMLSGREDRDALFTAIAAGAKGYVAKDADPSQLVAAIALIVGGGTVFSESVAAGLAEGISDLDYEPGEYQRRRLDLSEREVQILRLLATPMATAQIASHLFLSPKTIQNHVSAIYRKLDVRTRSDAVVKGIDLNLIPGKTS
jgi:two-component system response regulator DegU